MWHIKCFFLAISLLALYPSIAPAVNSDINDNIFDILQKLETEGIIQSSLLTTQPLSRKEIIRLIHEAESNDENSSLFIHNLIKNLKKQFIHELDREQFVKPVENPYLQLSYTDSGISNKITYNSEGYNQKKGPNLRFGLSSSADLIWSSYHIDPEIRYSKGQTVLFVNKAYGILNLFGMELELGRDSQWWGPGYHGALLLTNNPESLTILKLTNSRPSVLPYVLSYLGLFKFSFFVTQLEEDRDVPNPFLWGVRINFKPNPYIEVGLNRTAVLGGRGRSKGLKTWLKSFAGMGENVDVGTKNPGDQKGGIDLKFTIPFSWQPVQLYTEIAGEDEAGGLPSREAYIAGIYFSRIINLERLDFRVEYSTTHVKNYPNMWYTHGVYTSGYTYKSQIIGHHAGTDSKDLFLETRYFLTKPENGKISISYSREEHNLSGTVHEISDDVTLKVNLPVKNNFDIKTVYRYGQIKNFEKIEKLDTTINILMSYIIYKF